MLPSLSAGTFECGRPQIVFERGIFIVVSLGSPGMESIFQKSRFSSTQKSVQFTDNMIVRPAAGLLSA